MREHTFQLGGKTYIPSHFCGQISRNRVELALCGTDFSIFVQIEHAMFWGDQGVSA